MFWLLVEFESPNEDPDDSELEVERSSLSSERLPSGGDSASCGDEWGWSCCDGGSCHEGMPLNFCGWFFDRDMLYR